MQQLMFHANLIRIFSSYWPEFSIQGWVQMLHFTKDPSSGFLFHLSNCQFLYVSSPKRISAVCKHSTFLFLFHNSSLNSRIPNYPWYQDLLLAGQLVVPCQSAQTQKGFSISEAAIIKKTKTYSFYQESKLYKVLLDCQSCILWHQDTCARVLLYDGRLSLSGVQSMGIYSYSSRSMKRMNYSKITERIIYLRFCTY